MMRNHGKVNPRPGGADGAPASLGGSFEVRRLGKPDGFPMGKPENPRKPWEIPTKVVMFPPVWSWFILEP